MLFICRNVTVNSSLNNGDFSYTSSDGSGTKSSSYYIVLLHDMRFHRINRFILDQDVESALTKIFMNLSSVRVTYFLRSVFPNDSFASTPNISRFILYKLIYLRVKSNTNETQKISVKNIHGVTKYIKPCTVGDNIKWIILKIA